MESSVEEIDRDVTMRLNALKKFAVDSMYGDDGTEDYTQTNTSDEFVIVDKRLVKHENVDISVAVNQRPSFEKSQSILLEEEEAKDVTGELKARQRTSKYSLSSPMTRSDSLSSVASSVVSLDVAVILSLQLGIADYLSKHAEEPIREVSFQEFNSSESCKFPRDYNERLIGKQFELKVYAPEGFRYFRHLFDIQERDFIKSVCHKEINEIGNAGSSGSYIFATYDDKYILKTVSREETRFLIRILLQYQQTVQQGTFLPRFFGLYRYKRKGKAVRFIVMNNLFPSTIKMHKKYDIKGSIINRRASDHERSKESPTFKDLDFIDDYKDGLFLVPEVYDKVMEGLKRDTRLLTSLGIMDYSLLLGVHYVGVDADHNEDSEWTLKKPYIAARTADGARLQLYMGIIDMLQTFRLIKMMELSVKAVIHKKKEISVNEPSYYTDRFIERMQLRVFKVGLIDKVYEL